METYSTKHLSTSKIHEIIDILDESGMDYYANNTQQTIRFNMEDVDGQSIPRLREMLGDPLQESKKLKNILRPIVTEILREIRNKKK